MKYQLTGIRKPETRNLKLIIMPRVLRIINRFNLGGPTYNVAYLSRYLEPGYETLLAGGARDASEGSSEYILENLGLKPVIIPSMRREISWGEDRKAYLEIKKIIRDFRPDIVHTHASKAGTLGRLAAHSGKVPVILHTFHGHVFHSYFGKIQTLFYKNIERYLARKSTAIIAISEKQKEELSRIHQICPPEKIEVIPLGFDLQKFRERQEEKRLQFRTEYAIDKNEIVIMIIGRLVPVKNHGLFLKAFQYVKNHSNRPVRAFIVGDGEERQHIEGIAGGLGLEFSSGKGEKSTVHFTSWIKDADIACAGADIVALSSFNEGTPVSLIEAQAAGKPVVSTAAGGTENVVLHGKTGLLSPGTNEQAFYENMLELVNNDSLRREFGENGWDHVRESFHYTRLVRDMKNLYDRLLASPHQGIR